MSDDTEVLRLTLADLKKGLDLPNGRRYQIVILADLVVVHIDWPSQVVERLPDDFALTLSGPDLPKRKLPKESATEVDEGMMRFEFRWRDKGKTVMLEAEGAGQKVLLWRGHVAGNLSVAVDWGRRLDPLLAPYDEIQIEGQNAGATEMPDDPRAHELTELVGDLFS